MQNRWIFSSTWDARAPWASSRTRFRKGQRQRETSSWTPDHRTPRSTDLLQNCAPEKTLSVQIFKARKSSPPLHDCRSLCSVSPFSPPWFPCSGKTTTLKVCHSRDFFIWRMIHTDSDLIPPDVNRSIKAVFPRKRPLPHNQHQLSPHLAWRLK